MGALSGTEPSQPRGAVWPRGVDRPAPSLAGELLLPDGRRVRARRARPADAGRIQQFVRSLAPHTRAARYFAPIRELARRELERMVGGEGGLTLLAEEERSGDIRAIAEYVPAGPADTEVAVVVADGWQGARLGETLLRTLLEHASRAGIRLVSGIVHQGNGAMLMLAAKLSFAFLPGPEEELVRIEKWLVPA